MLNAGRGFAGLRVMYGAAVIGAGLVGAIMLFVPSLAGRYIFAGDIIVDEYVRILGALWLALGLVAAIGLARPAPFIPLLMIQLVYKAAWLVVAAYPAILAGNRSPGLIFLAALFTLWVIALIAFVPFRAFLTAS